MIAVILQTPTLDLPCIGWGYGRDLLSRFQATSNPKSWIRAYKIIIYFKKKDPLDMTITMHGIFFQFKFFSNF